MRELTDTARISQDEALVAISEGVHRKLTSHACVHCALNEGVVCNQILFMGFTVG